MEVAMCPDEKLDFPASLPSKSGHVTNFFQMKWRNKL